MAGLFETIATEDPNFLSSSEENAARAEKAAANAANDAGSANADAAEAKKWKELAAGAVSGVALFNDRFGDVKPKAGDYTADMVGARASTWVPSWTDISNRPNVLTTDTAQTITSLKSFKGPVKNNFGLQFGNNNSGLTENPLTNDIEIVHGQSLAVLGLQADGVMFSKTNTGSKYRYYTEANPFPLTATYKLYSGNVASSYVANATNYSVFNLNLTSANTAFSFATLTLSEAQARQVTVCLKQGNGAQKVTWASNIKWSQGRAPTLSLEMGRMDVITFMTFDLGATWLGFYNGGWF